MQITQNKQFIKYIAYLQVIGIILVVLGHSLHEYPDGDLGRTTLLHRMMHSFTMPLFLFVSGFLMVLTTQRRASSPQPSIAHFIKQKLKRLILPFAFLTIITFIPRALLSNYADDSVDMSITTFLKALFYSDSLIIPYFWYIQANFLLLVFNYSIITLGEKLKISNLLPYIFLTLLFAILPLLPIDFGWFFSISNAIGLGFYFVLGAFYSKFADKLNRLIPWESPFFLLFTTATWAFLFFITENTPCMLFCSIFGIAMCISVAKLLELHKITIFDHLIGANYIIFLLSWYCNVTTQQGFHNFVTLPWWCHSILSLVSGVYLPWLLYRYLQRHSNNQAVRVATTILGQSFKHNSTATKDAKA